MKSKRQIFIILHLVEAAIPSNGEFLLYSRRLEVQRWLRSREARGYDVRVKGSLCDSG